MPFYPQLASGSIAQYPITRNNIRRTVINLMGDGTQIAMTDAGAAAVNWSLGYSELTSAESDALQQLFASSYGRWQTFGFLDPTDNLLNWSEDLSQAEWEPAPLLTLSGGHADAVGGTSGWRVINTAQASQAIVQTLAIPSSYQYCLSLYARADVAASFELTANSISQTANAPLTWTRVVFPFQLSSETGSLEIGVVLPAGGSVYLFGLQLEAQPGAGAYKKTLDIAGVYPNSRFDQDVLTTTATGTNQFSTTVKILSNVPG